MRLPSLFVKPEPPSQRRETNGAAWRRVLFLSLWAGLVFASAGQPATTTNKPAPVEGLVIRSWGTEAGLPQNTVNAMVQTRDGYLWLATRDGLARFDGVRFTVFGLPEGLQSVDVATLYEDRQGTLWIGTVGGGLARWTDGRVERVTPPNPEMGADTISTLAEDAAGRLWIGTPAGLRLWENGRLVENDALAGFAHLHIRTLFCDRHGTMWIVTVTQGLFEFKDNQATLRPGPPGNERVVAHCLLEDRQGDLWASVGNWKILRLHDGQWRVYDQNDGVPYAYVTSLAEERDGTIWAGSLDDGLYRFNGDRFSPVRREDGLSANDIRSLRVDREDNLWVGTRTGGLNRVSRRKLSHYGVAQGLTNDFARSVAQTSDGTLWVATTGGGLYQGDLRNGFHLLGPNEMVQYYAQAESVLAQPDGSVWWGGGRALLRWKDGGLAGCYTNEPWVRSAWVTALCDDRRGGLWIGNSESALVHFQNGEFTGFPQAVARGPITALAQTTNGWLWIGSPGGGLRRMPPDGAGVQVVARGLLSQSIRTLYLDDQDTLWIGTAGGGLSRWRDGRIVTFTSQQGLGAKTVSQIVEDNYGCLWLGCNRGIVRVRKAELDDLAAGRTAFLHPRAYGVNDGMPAEECSSGFCPAGLKTRSGLVCFSTVKGLVFLDPRQPETNAAPPGVHLEEVFVNGKLQRLRPWTPGNGAYKGATPPARELILPEGSRELELRYTGISFASPEKINFRYRLEGLERDWVEAGTRRTAYYQRIPSGQFVFHVTACNADGLWNDQGAALAITMRPSFWETPWFPLGVGVLLLSAAAATFRVVEQRKFRRRLALLETQHAVERERLRIAQDMHDHIGGMLTQVSQLSDLGESEAKAAPPIQGRFQRIGAQARAAVQALDEIIWATNPKNDNLPRFAEYVSRFADEFFESGPVRCWQDIPANPPGRPLGAEVRHDVFLAFREALNNVLKHAAATQVWVRLLVDTNQACLEVEDNGRGFDPSRPAVGGNGLENMRSRLAECGGRTELTSAPGRGTKIRFLFPLS